MCGFTGFVDFTQRSTQEILAAQTTAIHHRGPDDTGYFFENYTHFSLGLGHKRLSILDLSPLGHQPMHFEQYSIVYNGEVYNFKEVRENLIEKGYSFVSNSDTEVILKGFHLWGVDLIQQLNGMFAIAIYDKLTEKLTLIRDRAGVKPLYYYFENGLFLMGSELKSFYANPRFNKKINLKALSLYLQYGYINQPYTIFENTHKLQQGHFLELDCKTQQLKTQQYWSIFEQYEKPKSTLSETETLANLEELLQSACNYRMIADVPVGVFLSGGYDSSLVAAMVQKGSAQKIKTFTIGFNHKNYNEAPHAKKVAEHLGTQHHEHFCEAKEALDLLPLLPYHYDEPFADSSAIPTMLVSKITRESVTVALSADGSDELFSGYEKYKSTQKYWDIYNKIPFSKALLPSFLGVNRNWLTQSGALNNVQLYLYDNFIKIGASKTVVEALDAYQKAFLEEELLQLNPLFTADNLFYSNKQFTKNIENNLDKMMAFDYASYQADDILTKVDRATMAFSLEGREPLLDYRLAEFVATIPNNFKVKNGVEKYLLKQIVHKYLPKSIMERPKMGFGVPIISWLTNELKPQVLQLLSKENIAKQGLFNAEAVQKMVNHFYKTNDLNYATRIWYLFVFQLWYKKWME